MHIGQLIKQELENQGRSVVWFAEKMAYSRTNVYKIFERPSIDADVLLRISVILDVDFFKYYSSELKNKKKKLLIDNFGVTGDLNTYNVSENPFYQIVRLD